MKVVNNSIRNTAFTIRNTAFNSVNRTQAKLNRVANVDTFFSGSKFSTTSYQGSEAFNKAFPPLKQLLMDPDVEASTKIGALNTLAMACAYHNPEESALSRDDEKVLLDVVSDLFSGNKQLFGEALSQLSLIDVYNETNANATSSGNETSTSGHNGAPGNPVTVNFNMPPYLPGQPTTEQVDNTNPVQEALIQELQAKIASLESTPPQTSSSVGYLTYLKYALYALLGISTVGVGGEALKLWDAPFVNIHEFTEMNNGDGSSTVEDVAVVDSTAITGETPRSYDRQGQQQARQDDPLSLLNAVVQDGATVFVPSDSPRAGAESETEERDNFYSRMAERQNDVADEESIPESYDVTSGRTTQASALSGLGLFRRSRTAEPSREAPTRGNETRTEVLSREILPSAERQPNSYDNLLAYAEKNDGQLGVNLADGYTYWSLAQAIEERVPGEQDVRDIVRGLQTTKALEGGRISNYWLGKIE